MNKLNVNDEDYYSIVVQKNDTRVEYGSKTKSYYFSVKSSYSLEPQAAKDLLECLTEVMERVNAREEK